MVLPSTGDFSSAKTLLVGEGLDLPISGAYYKVAENEIWAQISYEKDLEASEYPVSGIEGLFNFYAMKILDPPPPGERWVIETYHLSRDAMTIIFQVGTSKVSKTHKIKPYLCTWPKFSWKGNSFLVRSREYNRAEREVVLHLIQIKHLDWEDPSREWLILLGLLHAVDYVGDENLQDCIQDVEIYDCAKPPVLIYSLK